MLTRMLNWCQQFLHSERNTLQIKYINWNQQLFIDQPLITLFILLEQRIYNTIDNIKTENLNYY